MSDQSERLSLRRAAEAAKNMDWQQVVQNGGPPCFHIENGRFCGRAFMWEGHIGGVHHWPVPLNSLFESAIAAPDDLAEAVRLLRELHAMVRGECPSLLSEDSGGSAHLDVKIEAFLKRQEQTDA